MSTLATKGLNELRTTLHERIDHCTEDELEAVRKALLKLEAERAFAEMSAEAEADHLAGKHDPALVEAAIREHRARHLYR